MQLPKMPNYNIGVGEFDKLSLSMTRRMMEALEDAREETIEAMKGKVPLDRLGGIPRESLSPEEQQQLRYRTHKK